MPVARECSYRLAALGLLIACAPTDGANQPVEAPPTTRSDGSSHTCALRTGGEVVCWGHNGAFQLGLGSGPSRSLPQDIPGLDGVAVIAAGGIESCALKTTGEVICWPRSAGKAATGMASSEAALAVALDP